MLYDLSDYSHLTVYEKVCGGRPVIRDTHIEPEDICLYLSAQHVQSDFPHLKPEAIMECFHYFAHYI